MTEKIYLTAEALLEDAFCLGTQILDSGFIPDLIIGVWRGGSPIAIAIHELFTCMGVEIDHIPVRSRFYKGIDERSGVADIYGLDYLAVNLDKIQRILIVDDVFDSGLSMNQILLEIDAIAGEQQLENRVAVPWFKPANNRTNCQPDYFLHTTDAWLVFPHELCGLSKKELLERKPGIDVIKHLFK